MSQGHGQGGLTTTSEQARIGPRHLAAVLAVVSAEPWLPASYRRRLAAFPDLVRVTVDVTQPG
jgi:hypothetical protein